MSVSDPSGTGRLAYEHIKDSGLISESQLRVLALLVNEGRHTRNEIDQKLGTGVNPNFSRRLVEMERTGIIRRAGVRRCSITNRLCDDWEPTGELPHAPLPAPPTLREQLDAANKEIDKLAERLIFAITRYTELATEHGSCQASKEGYWGAHISHIEA